MLKPVVKLTFVLGTSLFLFLPDLFCKTSNFSNRETPSPRAEVNTLSKAVKFSAPGDYLEVAHDATLATPEFTIEFWLKIDDLGDPELADGEQTIIDKRGDGGYNFRLAGTEFPIGFFALALPGDISWSLADQGRWYHIAVSQSMDTLTLFLDGKLVSKVASIYNPQTDSPLRIGEFLGYPGASLGLKGELDEFRIWDYPRTEEEVSADMHDFLTGMEPGLMAYWSFDEMVEDNYFPDLTNNGNSAYIFGNTTCVVSEAPVGFVPPDPPSGIRAFGEMDGIEVHWKTPNSEGLTFLVYRSQQADRSDALLVGRITADRGQFFDPTAESGLTYFYWLVAEDADKHQSQISNLAVSRLRIIEDYLTGVYYYPWYGTYDGGHDWENEYLRDFLVPAQPPLLGHYSNRNQQVVQTHLQWLKDYQIDFLVSSWWGHDSPEEVTLRNYILPEISNTNIEFSIYYESTYLGFGPAGIEIEEIETDLLVTDFKHMADQYFSHPNYLKIDGKPVVFIYLSRIFSGDFEEAFTKVREEVRKKGFELYLIGDEVGWGGHPSWHSEFLDAVSPYIMYGNPNHAGYPLETAFFSDVSKQMRDWELEAAPRNLKVIPNVHPGFNGIRLTHSNPVHPAPRRVDSTADVTSFFSEYIKVARPFVDPDLKMIMITSFNEWHEDTQIEPVVAATPTNQDNSNEGSFYTVGYTYEGYGFSLLDTVKSLLGVEVVNSVHEGPAEELHLSLSPNPSYGNVQVSFSLSQKEQVQITLYDLYGKNLLQLPPENLTIGEWRLDLDLAGRCLVGGVYILNVRMGKSKRISRLYCINVWLRGAKRPQFFLC